MDNEEIIVTNKTYWNDHADLWYGTTALPAYGVRFPTEDDLHLFGNVANKKMLEICCGSGHSLKYNADRGASELWGIDLSQKQLDNAAELLKENGYSANLICAKWKMNWRYQKNILIMFILYMESAGQQTCKVHLIK